MRTKFESMTGLSRVERIAEKIAAGNPLTEASWAAFGIIDGIDGMLSEQDESFVWKYWKKDILTRWDKIAGKIPVKEEILPILRDLIDGFEGYFSEKTDIHRYWKPNALQKAKAAERKLRAL